MNTRQTHTFALLEVSKEIYDEIYSRLEQASYDHAFLNQDGRPVIDMHGIGLAIQPEASNDGIPNQVTVFDWPTTKLHSQYGFVTFREWCREEAARINSANGRRAEVIEGSGLNSGQIAVVCK